MRKLPESATYRSPRASSASPAGWYSVGRAWAGPSTCQAAECGDPCAGAAATPIGIENNTLSTMRAHSADDRTGHDLSSGSTTAVMDRVHKRERSAGATCNKSRDPTASAWIEPACSAETIVRPP